MRRRLLTGLVAGAAAATVAWSGGWVPWAMPWTAPAGPEQVAVALEAPAPRDVHGAAPVTNRVVDGSTERWTRILGRLDRRRAVAFATGDASLLSEVYRSGSAVLARDRAVLTAYAARGLTVQGARLRLLDVRERRVAQGVVVLRVVDRLGSVTARTAEDAAWALPHDRPTVHRLVLRSSRPSGQGVWRIAAVIDRSG